MSQQQDEPFNSDDVLLFSGSSHPKLAQDIAKHLGIEVSPTTTTEFSNNNFEVQLGETVRQKEVFLLQSLVAPTSDHLLELLMMLDIASKSGARRVHAVIPYYSYARSDKKDAPRISITGRLIADLLVTAGAQHIITMTLHSPQVHGFFSVHTDSLTAQSVFVNYFRQKDLHNAVVVSPDIGNAKRASKLAQALKLPLAIGEKVRLSDDTVLVSSVLGDVRGKRVLLMDDEIATGGTMVELIKMLRKQGAGPVSVICTHGLFSGSARERLNDVPDIEEIVTTNTVPLPPERRPDRLVTLSVGHVFGEVIKCTVQGESVGELFEFWPDT